MAILKQDFTCAPNGAIVKTFKAGEEVTGIVAKWAREQGLLEPEKKADKKPQQNKARKGKIENK